MTPAQACMPQVGPMHFWVHSVNLFQPLLRQHSFEHPLCQLFLCRLLLFQHSWLPARFGESVGDFLRLEEAGLEEGNLAPLQTLPSVSPKRSLLPELVALSWALVQENPEQVTVLALAQESHADACSLAAVASEAEDLEAWLVVAQIPVCPQI